MVLNPLELGAMNACEALCTHWGPNVDLRLEQELSQSPQPSDSLMTNPIHGLKESLLLIKTKNVCIHGRDLRLSKTDYSE